MTRKGGWIETYTGNQCFPLDPRQEEIHIEDIAHALSLVCGFNGQSRFFYSVGQHSLGVQEELAKAGYPAKIQIYGLLHDAAEAYICDLTRPVKPFILGYYEIEGVLQSTIHRRFGLAPMLDEHIRWVIKEFDDMLLRAEGEALTSNCAGWINELPLCNRKIVSENPISVEKRFLKRFEELQIKLLVESEGEIKRRSLEK